MRKKRTLYEVLENSDHELRLALRKVLEKPTDKLKAVTLDEIAEKK